MKLWLDDSFLNVFMCVDVMIDEVEVDEMDELFVEVLLREFILFVEEKWWE